MTMVRSMFVVLATALLTFAGVELIPPMLRVKAQSVISVTTRVDRLPFREDFVVRPLPDGVASVNATRAMARALQEFNLTQSAVDSSIGVVGALLTERANPRVQNRAVWITTVTMDLPAPGGRIVYHKLSIVVDAESGQYLLAYSGDPTLP